MTFALPTCLLSGLLSAVLGVPSSAVRLHVPESVAQVLLDGAAEDLSESQLVGRLSGLGLTGLPGIFETLSRGYAPQGGLDAVQRRALVASVGRLPRAGVLTWFHKLANRPLSAGERRCALELLAPFARGAQLSLLLGLTVGEDPTAPIETSVRLAFQTTLRALLRRDLTAARHVQDQYGGAHPGLLAPLIEALGTHAHGDRIGTLTRLLGQREEADALILLALRGQLSNWPRPTDLRTLDALLGALEQQDANELQLAARGQS